jgi:phenylpyruvate tautomerase PptA (4-oxalocrotonate tautomerase family)
MSMMCLQTTLTAKSCEDAKRGKRCSGCGLTHQQTKIVVTENIDSARRDRDDECQRPSTGQGADTMPIYTCTVVQSTLSADTKCTLAGEIARIHSSINHVPSTYVNVAFHELAADGLYTDGAPASPVLVSGWVRDGHPEEDTTSLATEIATAVSRICDIDAKKVLVVIQSSPARSAVEGGRVLPEPGHEQSWIAGN